MDANDIEIMKAQLVQERKVQGEYIKRLDEQMKFHVDVIRRQKAEINMTRTLLATLFWASKKDFIWKYKYLFKKLLKEYKVSKNLNSF